MKYFLIAGEASGDIHAGRLVRALRQQDPNAEFAYLGGDYMQEASGVPPLSTIRTWHLWPSRKCSAICLKFWAT